MTSEQHYFKIDLTATGARGTMDWKKLLEESNISARDKAEIASREEKTEQMMQAIGVPNSEIETSCYYSAKRSIERLNRK